MKKYNTAKKQTNRKLKALQDNMKKLREKGDDLAERHTMLLKRQKDLADQHGGSKVRGSDMIELNIGGKKMRALRETLTLIEGSRLEVLFSGRWESKLLRDDQGCVFFDLDPYYFKKVVEYLYLVKVKKTSKGKNIQDFPKFPDSHEQKIFDIYIDFFRLKGDKEGKSIVPSTILSESSSDDSSASEDDEDDTSYDGLLTAFQEEEKEIAKVEQDLEKMEEKLAAEEDFVAFFTNEDQSSEYDSDDISFASMSSDMSSVFERKSASSSKSDTDTMTIKKTSILILWMGDEIVPVKRSTLCLCKGSQLAEDFSNIDWIKKHSFKSDDGTEVILVEHLPSIIKLIVNRLRLRAMMMTSGGGELPEVKMNNPADTRLLTTVVSTLFEGKEDFILGDKPRFTMDSQIIASKLEEDQMKTWLAEVNRTSEPELLYRATRDGWSPSDFHSKCDDKGATITIVKTSEGYVFGGYSDQSWAGNHCWKSSNDAFLFSLKCHAGIEPTKMKLKSGKNGEAVYCRPDYGPIFGEDDLYVSDSNDLKSGCTYLNKAYELPPGALNTFLTGNPGGSNLFTVAEVEVFRV